MAAPICQQRVQPARRLGVFGTLVLVASATLVVIQLSEGPARAAFPGSNGRIAFVGRDRSGIFAINPDGTDKERLTQNPAGAPAYSPNGNKIAYSRGYPCDIYKMSADGSKRRRLRRDGVSPTWSANGKRLVFAAIRVPGRYDVFTMEADGTKTRRLTRKGIDDYSPAWSPDGTRIAFIRLGSLYTMTADGSDKHEVTSYAGEPDWQSR